MNGKPLKPVLGEGPEDPEGILIGEGPGRDEEEQGRPFVGVTGQQLNDELLSVKLRRSRLFILNATACRPPATGKTEQLMQRAVMACRPLFLKQLASFPLDTPMLAMGKWAAVAVLGFKPKGIMKARGFIRSTVVPQTWSTKGKTPHAEDRTAETEVRRGSTRTAGVQKERVRKKDRSRR